MRSLLIENVINVNEILKIVIMNTFYVTISVLFFLRMIKVARNKGLLFNQGE